jgi:aspartate carbamoyltransferase regulatory subunit
VFDQEAAEMKIDSIQNGIVLDHIRAGRSMEIYRLLGLDRLDCSVAIIKNVRSTLMGKKDIIKIADRIDINLEVLGFVDPGITVDLIENGVLVQKKHVQLPEKLVNVLKCKNPRCITSTEQELPHVFRLTNRAEKVYRCIYCETKYDG